ncbi:MAG TPA: sulfatase-like hydrolase/transferase [Acidobacteriaceae bacterium]|jgi:hypothetical protein
MQAQTEPLDAFSPSAGHRTLGAKSSSAGAIAGVSVGISALVFLNYIEPLASPRHNAAYHMWQPASAIFIPVLVNVLVFCLVCFLALWLTRGRANRVLWAAVLCFGPWIALRNITSLIGDAIPHGVSALVFALCAAVFVVIAAGTSPAISRLYKRLRTGGEVVLSSIGLFGALSIAQVAWAGLQAKHLNDQHVGAPAPVAQALPRQRVIWLIFDELAYRQLYGHRLPGLYLPAFDQLRSESTVFSDVQPAGIATDKVVPSLMTGDRVTDIRSSAAGQLSLHTPAGWEPFEQYNSVFSDADSAGYRSAVVGWFNPYCRILSAVVSSCFWIGPSSLDDLFPGQTIGANIIHPLIRVAKKILPFLHSTLGPTPDELDEGNLHIRDFQVLDRAADAALADPRNTFLLIHMPVPHPIGIWDRHTHQFAVGRSCYVDNLALADEYLAHVRHLLKGSHQWDSSTIVIMGDHSWRTRLLWLKVHAWSPDDQQASDGGQYDPRPAYLVKLPNEHTYLDLNEPYSAVRTRALLDNLLLARFSTPGQLKEWVDHQSAGPHNTAH